MEMFVKCLVPLLLVLLVLVVLCDRLAVVEEELRCA